MIMIDSVLLHQGVEQIQHSQHDDQWGRFFQVHLRHPSGSLADGVPGGD